jgi:hypothetical protein
MTTLIANQIASIDGTKTLLNNTGGVLQTLSVYDNTQYTFVTGSSNQDTYFDIAGLTLTITPASASNKIMIIASIAMGQITDAYNCFTRLYRGSTPIFIGNPANYKNGCSASFRSMPSSGYAHQDLATIAFLDSPATTSPVTYSIKCCNPGGSAYASYINRCAGTDTSWFQNCGSNLLIMEISA